MDRVQIYIDFFDALGIKTKRAYGRNIFTQEAVILIEDEVTGIRYTPEEASKIADFLLRHQLKREV